MNNLKSFLILSCLLFSNTLTFADPGTITKSDISDKLPFNALFKSAEENEIVVLPQEKFKKEYLSPYINIIRLDDVMPVSLSKNSALATNADTVFMAGGKKEKASGENINYIEENTPILYDMSKEMWYVAGKSEYSREMPLLLHLPEKGIIIIGGGEKAPIEIYSYNAVSKPPRKLNVPEADINVLNGFTFLDKSGNVIFGKQGNDFVEKFNIFLSKTQKIKDIKTKGVYSGQDNDKVYFATSNTLYSLDKNTLEFKEYAYNENFEEKDVVSAYRMPSGLVLVAEKDGVYLFEENVPKKRYLFKSYEPQKKIQFFKFPFSNNMYFIAGVENTEIYKIDFDKMLSVPVLTLDLAQNEEYVPLVMMPNGSIIIAGGCGQYVYKMIENRNIK